MVENKIFRNFSLICIGFSFFGFVQDILNSVPDKCEIILNNCFVLSCFEKNILAPEISGNFLSTCKKPTTMSRKSYLHRHPKNIKNWRIFWTKFWLINFWCGIQIANSSIAINFFFWKINRRPLSACKNKIKLRGFWWHGIRHLE